MIHDRVLQIALMVSKIDSIRNIQSFRLKVGQSFDTFNEFQSVCRALDNIKKSRVYFDFSLKNNSSSPFITYFTIDLEDESDDDHEEKV